MDATVIRTKDVEAARTALTPFAGLRQHYYGAIAVDPASKFSSYTSIQSQNWNSRRDNERHYSVKTFEKLAALPVRELAAPTGCHMFIWSWGPFLLQALRLIDAWGFRYSTRAFTWVKTRRDWEVGDPLFESDFHIGLTVRHQTEFVLLARHGNVSQTIRAIFFDTPSEYL